MVAPEDRCSDFASGDYSYPQSVEADIVEAMEGRIYGPYTGTCFSSIRETDIEHIIAKSEAHDSGLCSADAGTKRNFARDLLNLTLANRSVNRHQKGDKDAADWLPELNQCWYADRIVQVRLKYGLTIDQREADTLESVLSACESVNMVFTECAGGIGHSRFIVPVVSRRKRPWAAQEALWGELGYAEGRETAARPAKLKDLGMPDGNHDRPNRL